MNKQALFSRQLAKWLCHVDWHYKTLLGVSIECVDKLPDDCDELINDLLLHYPQKPSENQITDFLYSSPRLSNWFISPMPGPVVVRLNLDSPTFTSQTFNHPPDIDTLKDLTNWLGITHSELDWFASFWRFNPDTPEHLKHYQYQLLKKQDGSKRLIEKPKVRLKRLQRKIYQEILSTADAHPAAHGFCKRKSCKTHASIHAGKRYLMLFDLADCFHSIGWSQVQSVFKKMGYAEAVSSYLTALCTHSVHFEKSQSIHFDHTQKAKLRQRHLPQGSPTSPALVNAVLHQLDSRLSGLAKSLDLEYSRYADDMVLSGNAHRDWRFLEPLVGGICLDEGVSINHRKTRIKRAHQKQRIVGIVVNKKPNIDRKHFDVLKAILTNCTRYGIESQNRGNHPQFRAHLRGRIQYVKSLNEQKGLNLERIYQNIA